MKKVKVILFTVLLCLANFSTQNNVLAQSSCSILESDLDYYEIWEENSHYCLNCEIDGDPRPVVVNGEIIGYEYDTAPRNTIETEIVCHYVVENETEFCHQRLVTVSGDVYCEPVFVPNN